MQMDFLDPRRKRAHRRRLFLGYALMSIVVALGTMIVLYLAYGFDIDRKTGNLIQNGIVFVDSKPQGANIYLNEVEQGSRTDTRMVLPAGTYTIRIEAEGYRHWERTFNLSGGQIQRLVYPLLLPNNLETSDVQQYDLLPGFATQSPDRRWVLVQRPTTTYQFDVYDLNNPEANPKSIVVPPNILTDPSAESSLSLVEWSNDNRHVLFKRTYGAITEFLMIDREQPSESFSINKTFGISPEVISLRNKHYDKFYYQTEVPGVLRIADLGNKTISAPVLENVIDYSTYGDDIIVYATQEDVEPGKTDFRILEGDKTYVLKTIKESNNYLMDVSKYDGEWYYVVGSSSENITSVYENPLSALKNQTKTPLLITALMRLDNPQFVSFSANTQFIGVQSGNEIVTLDLYENHQYRLKLDQQIPTAQQIKWMDGHRYIYTVDDQSYIVDFDGSNVQTLVTSRLRSGPFFDRDYDNVLTFEESKADGNKKALTITVIDD